MGRRGPGTQLGLRLVALHGISATQLQMRQRTNRLVQYHGRTGENLLQLGGSGNALTFCQVRFPARVTGTKRGIHDAGRTWRVFPQLFSNFVARNRLTGATESRTNSRKDCRTNLTALPDYALLPTKNFIWHLMASQMTAIPASRLIATLWQTCTERAGKTALPPNRCARAVQRREM